MRYNEWRLARVYFTATDPIRAVVIIEDDDGRVLDVWHQTYESMPAIWTDVYQRTGVAKWTT